MLLLTVPGLVSRVSSCDVCTKHLHLALSAPQPLSFPTEKFSGPEDATLKVLAAVEWIIPIPHYNYSHQTLQVLHLQLDHCRALDEKCV